MSSKTTMVLSVPVSAATFKDKVRLMASSGRQSFARLASYLEAIAGGPYAGSMSVAQGAVQAYGSLTIDSRPTADKVVIIANVTLTAKASGANGTTQFDTSATDSVTATNLAACINANTTLNKIVSAAADGDAVVVTAIVPGVVGNGLQLSTDATEITPVAAFANGSNGTLVTISNGY